MKRRIIILLFALTATLSYAQDFTNLLPPPPKTAQENNKNLLIGFFIQSAGIGMCAASVYMYLEGPEDQYEIAGTGLGTGIGLTITGTGLMIASISNMIQVRRSINEMKKNQKNKNLSFHIGPTNYGVGLVCRF